MTRAVWRGRVGAESDETRDLAGFRYFPRAAVRMDLLRPAPRTPRDLECPHGVRFFDVTDGEHTSLRAAWSYESPGPACAAVDHWIGFWDDVVLT
jgi:uncharacterized protein (DUF427 family)